MTLHIVDDAGELVRAFSSDPEEGCGPRLPIGRGVNSFHWNLRYPGAVEVVDEFSSWSRPDGPMVVPGLYHAELTVDGMSLRQPFEILPDPRVAAGLDALVEQRDMLLTIRDRLSANNELINRLATLRTQVRHWQARTDDPTVTATGDAILAGIEAVLPELIDVNIHQAQLYPSGLHEKLNALFDSVDSADYAPPQQAKDVLRELSEHLDRQSEQVETVLAERIRAFNDVVQATGLGPVDW